MTTTPAEDAPPRPEKRTRLWAGLGLRARVTVTFGLGALLLSVAMGSLSYFTARHFLVAERHNAAVTQTYVNASQLRSDLHGGTASVDTVLYGLDTSPTASSVLYQGGQWYATDPFTEGQSVLPVGLRAMVRSGNPATQTFYVADDPQIAVGVPIPSIGGAYFEIFDESDLAHTLRVLALAIVAGGIVTTLLGIAVGRSASSRSLRPLTGVSRAALAIAGGQLETRLPEASGDPDLAGLTSSFNLMVDQLEERIDREARFTSDVSHELRSPLTTISATLGVLEAHRQELSAPAREALMLLGEDLRRFQRMVGDLLEISRSDTGSADVSLEEVDAGALVRHSVAAGLRNLSPNAPMPRIEIDPVVGEARLQVDKRRFERVMANLLENAALYGGGATLVSLRPESDGTHKVVITVEDNGPGLEPSERARVFERFYRGTASGRRGAGTGTGLGLALVAEHVRLNHGNVWAEEAEGGGSRFVIELPLASEDSGL